MGINKMALSLAVAGVLGASSRWLNKVALLSAVALVFTERVGKQISI